MGLLIASTACSCLAVTLPKSQELANALWTPGRAELSEGYQRQHGGTVLCAKECGCAKRLKNRGLNNGRGQWRKRCKKLDGDGGDRGMIRTCALYRRSVPGRLALCAAIWHDDEAWKQLGYKSLF